MELKTVLAGYRGCGMPVTLGEKEKPHMQVVILLTLVSFPDNFRRRKNGDHIVHPLRLPHFSFLVEINMVLLLVI